MNREIKFRGYSTTFKKWVYGCLVNNLWVASELSRYPKSTPLPEIITGQYEGDSWEDVVSDENAIVEVHPDSVGQYTGLKDKNGTNIYEGDILRWNKTSVVVCEFHNGAFGGRFLNDTKNNFWVNLSKLEIIGNVFSHPQLLTP